MELHYHINRQSNLIYKSLCDIKVPSVLFLRDANGTSSFTLIVIFYVHTN